MDSKSESYARPPTESDLSRKDELSSDAMWQRIRALEEERDQLRRELAELAGVRDELERSNRQLSLIIEHQPVVPYTCKAEGDYGATFVSPRMLDITGYPPENLVNEATFWSDRIHPDDREHVFRNLGDLFVHGHHEHEYRWLVADGSYRWFFDCLQLVTNADGEPQYIVGAWLDVTQRKLITEAQREQKEFLYTLIDAVPDLVFALNERGEFTLANRAFCERMQVSDSDIMHRTAAQVLAQERGRVYHERAANVMQAGTRLTSQDRFTDAGGREFLVETVMVPYGGTDGGIRGVIGIGRDVTEREQAAAALQEAKDRAEFASRSKTEFLANMSHEIRTPLNSILGYAQLLAKRAKDDSIPFYLSEYIEHIHSSGYNLLEIINNILELSKIEEGKVTISPEPLNLGLLTRRVYNLFKLQAVEKGIDFVYVFDDTLPRTIYSDQTKLTQILSNLLSNAIKFTPAGKRIELKVEKWDGHVRFVVVDQGIGIAKDKQGLIFEAFEQADSSITRSYGGTGLGLAITRRLCKLLKGRIWLESMPLYGTTFTVELPIETNSETEGMGEESDGDMPVFAMDSRVLVVEDNPMNQAVIRALFAELGLRVHIAGDGQEGVAAAVEHEPECIFMDLHMPRMDGLEATRQLRELAQFAEVPIIALSADAFTEQKEVALQAGITDYLTKPIRFEKLVGKLKKYLRVMDPVGKRKKIIDSNGLSEYSDSLLRQLVELFVTMVPVSLAKLRRYVDERERTALVEEAHSLKNSAMGVFATRFTALSSELELEGKRDGWDRIAELLPEIGRAYEEAAAELQAMVHERLGI